MKKGISPATFAVSRQKYLYYFLYILKTVEIILVRILHNNCKYLTVTQSEC